MNVHNARLWRSVFTAALAFAVLFTALAFAQDLYVRRSLAAEEAQRLTETIVDVKNTLLSKNNRWTPQALRQAVDTGPAYYIVTTADAQLIDSTVEPFPDLFSSVKERSTKNAQYRRNEVGELWEIASKRIAGGRVYVGAIVPSTQPTDEIDLRSDVARFGATIKSAAQIRTKDLSNAIDGYAVLTDAGIPLEIYGGLPYRVTLRLPRNMDDDRLRVVQYRSSDLAVMSEHYHGASPAIQIIAIEPVDRQEAITKAYRAYNITIGILSWIVVLVGTILYFVFAELRAKQLELSVEEALRRGEGQHIEFKEGFNEKTIPEAITAFSNSNVGNIFVGVTDDGRIAGIDASSPQSKDVLQKRLRNITAQSIQPPVFVRSAFLEVQGKVIMRIVVPRGNEPLYMFQNVVYVRHQSSVMKANPATVQNVVKAWKRASGGL